MLLKIKTIKKRVVRVLLTAGFMKFKILYIITGNEKKIPEKINSKSDNEQIKQTRNTY